jgi:hypothetical protein
MKSGPKISRCCKRNERPTFSVAAVQSTAAKHQAGEWMNQTERGGLCRFFRSESSPSLFRIELTPNLTPLLAAEFTIQRVETRAARKNFSCHFTSPFMLSIELALLL